MVNNNDKQPTQKTAHSAGSIWDVVPFGKDTYKIENHETKNATVISLATTNDRHCAFDLLKAAGFDEHQRSNIWNEVRRIQAKQEKPDKIQAAAKEFTDFLEMADRFIAIQPLFYTPQKIWWLWNFDKKCWQMVDEVDLLNRMSEEVDGPALFKPNVKSEVLNSLKMRGRLATPKPAPKTWIQFKGRICDIKTGKVFEATPEHFITNPIPWDLGEKPETPVMDELFREWVDEESVESLYEILAYCMLSDYPLHRVFCLNGGGRNGKGTFLRILTNFIGEANICSTDFDTLVNRPFEAAKLYKKLACQMGEINSSIFKRTSLFKKLCGSDMIGYEFKGKDGFDEYNYAKLIIATNKLPESTDKTVGFYARWMIIDFSNTFKENPDLLDRVPEQEYRNLGVKCLITLKKLLEKGEFTGEGTIAERTARYEERASPFNEFLQTCCEVEELSETPFWELYEEYVAYLEERGFRKASKRELSHLIRGRGLKTKRVNYNKSDGESSTMIVVLGLSLYHSYTDEERKQNEEHGGLHSPR